MDLSGLLAQCHIYTAAQSTFELLPQSQPAVYAFYEALDFSRGHLVDEVDAIVTKHGKYITMDTAGWPFHLKVAFRGNPERFKGEGRKLSKELDAKDLPSVQQQLLFLSFLNEPLYIGKTEDIRTRFKAHHDNGFLWKMKADLQQPRPPNEFMLFAYFCEEQYVRLIESILIQVMNPAFCDQKS